ncbi:MAG: DUF1800 family protein [Anaerolineae bacterium]|nr:DUF1800 family protein [Anaerolineae bacterium]
MKLSRREFLKLSGMAATALTASGCTVIGREMAKGQLPDTLTAPIPLQNAPTSAPAAGLPTMRVDPIWRFLNRAGYGPRPGDLERGRALGLAALVEEQLHPEQLDDAAADTILSNLVYYHKPIDQIVTLEPQDLLPELGLSVYIRALYSSRQLYEAMVEFWSDHFNIYLRKAQFMVALKMVDDREVIRPHALGSFRELLFASAQSPAMLVYLDNVSNEKGQPNENYARELLELHTLGVHGGYSQQDVQEVARILTGWGVTRRGRNQGQFQFYPERHDDGAKTVLGHQFPAGQGEQDVWQLLELLVTHPATATFIATKLVRRFVADEPPPDLVQQVAQTYQQTNGDIKAMLRIIFLSDAFATAPVKLKRPFTFMISALRALHADLRQFRRVNPWLERMGQPLFQWSAPDGYPDVSTAWVNNLLPRWNFALALTTGQLRGVTTSLERILNAGRTQDVPTALNLLAGLTLGRPLTADELPLFNRYVGPTQINDRLAHTRLAEAAALLLASPAFQWM